MRKLLNEISVIPGVTGSCIFDKTEGPLCQDLHPDLSQELLETVGIHLVRLVQMGKMIDLQARVAHFHFDKYTVVGLPLETGAVLLTICEAQANCSLVATTAAMLASDMRDQLAKGVTQAKMELAREMAAGQEQKNTAQVVDNEVLRGLLASMESALAGAIGPVAGVVIQDYVLKWQEAGPAVPARLSELANMLEGEIGDAELIRDFKANVAKFM